MFLSFPTRALLALQPRGVGISSLLLSGTVLSLARETKAQEASLIVGNEFQVNTNTTNDQITSDITNLSTGDFVVVWCGDQTGDYDIYAKRYGPDGEVNGSEFRVNTETVGTQFYPVITALPTGDFVVVWPGDQTGDYDIYAQSLPWVRP